MWIPYTDSVVVVHCNETQRAAAPKPWFSVPPAPERRLAALRSLLLSHSSVTLPQIADLTAMQLRDELIRVAPLDAVRAAACCCCARPLWLRVPLRLPVRLALAHARSCPRAVHVLTAELSGNTSAA